MKTTVSVYDFRDAFLKHRPDNFTYEGLTALYDYLESFEVDTGEELELDVIAICCDFAEESWQNISEYYSIDLDDCEDDEEKQQAVADYLTDEGVFIAQVGDSFVYRQH
jgi:predicted ArsR family transcriptional regulator